MGNWENKKQKPSKNQENIRNFHQDLTPFLIERECVYFVAYICIGINKKLQFRNINFKILKSVLLRNM